MNNLKDNLKANNFRQNQQKGKGNRGRQKRGATNLCGVLAVDKPAGLTSHDVVDRLRRITGEGRIGHAGTLDPAATGLLLLCVGPATKRSEKLMGHDKTYVARVLFGAATTTDDAQGDILRRAEIPAEISDAHFASELLARFLGEQDQLPPQFAAIKKDGRKAYELARKGELVELEPRSICIYQLELLAAGSDYWDICARVSKGTYLRALARDLGEAVGSAAHLGQLRRTSIGKVDITEAFTLEQIEAVGDVSKFWLASELLR